MGEARHSMPLNEKQIKFCKEYLIDLNATQAAIRTGYSAKTANRIASKLLSKVDIQKKLTELRGKIAEETQITPAVILGELLRLAKADISQAFDDKGNLKPIHEIPEDVRRAISSVEIFEEFSGSGKTREYIGQTKKLKFWDKTKSLELLGKHLAIFTEKVDHRSSDGTMTPKAVLVVYANGSEAKNDNKN